MKWLIPLALFGVLLCVSSVSSAQEAATDDTTEYTFEDDVVTGDLLRPDGGIISVRKRGKERSLIRVRQHFIPEMLKSVENL